MLQESTHAVIPQIGDLQPGVFCAALYIEDNSWYRARVLFNVNNTVSEISTWHLFLFFFFVRIFFFF